MRLARLVVFLVASCSSDAAVDEDSVTSTGPFVDHGGPVLSNGPDLFVIWYGDWGTGPGAARPVLHDFLANLGGSTYWSTLSTYGVRNVVTLQKEVDDDYSQGNKLVEYREVVRHHLEDLKDLPQESNAVYLVLPYVDVSFPKMCANLCGSHNHFSSTSITNPNEHIDVKIAWAVHPGRCTSVCGMPSHGGVTGNYAADWMPTTIAHELAEVITDPDLDAWYAAPHAEIADKCNRRFGNTWKTSSGADVNVELGGRQWLLQELWLNDPGTTRQVSVGGWCVLAPRN